MYKARVPDACVAYTVHRAWCAVREKVHATRAARATASAHGPRVTCQMTSQYRATSGGRRTRSKETPDECAVQRLAESAPSGWRSRVASRTLAYRRVPLHSEVSCRCGLTGSPALCSVASATVTHALLHTRCCRRCCSTILESSGRGGAHRRHTTSASCAINNACTSVHETLAYPLMN